MEPPRFRSPDIPQKPSVPRRWHYAFPRPLGPRHPCFCVRFSSNPLAPALPDELAPSRDQGSRPPTTKGNSARAPSKLRAQEAKWRFARHLGTHPASNARWRTVPTRPVNLAAPRRQTPYLHSHGLRAPAASCQALRPPCYFTS
jgi:hypothetical protein